MKLWFGALGIALALAVFALPFPRAGGDTPNYITVADNILFNHCVSRSRPESGACEPHWGGNQFPGYPALIALAGLLSGRSQGDPANRLETPVILLNVLLLSLAAWRFAAVARNAFQLRQRDAVLVLVVLCALPLHVAFAKFLLTETLALAATIWLFAELLASLHTGRLRIATLAMALAAGFFLRYDAIAGAAAIAVCAFLIHPPAVALRRGTLVALLFLIPVCVWTARNVAVGLSPVPKLDFGIGLGKPAGYLAWLETWTAFYYDGARAAYPLDGGHYSWIVIPSRAYDSPSEETEVRALMESLGRFERQEFPDAIDQAFARIAAERRARDPLRHWLVLPATRAAMLWLVPGFSAGFNIEFGDDVRDRLAEQSWKARGEFIRDNALAVLVKAGLVLLRLVVIGGFVVVLVRAELPLSHRLSWLVLSYAIAKTLFLVYQGFDEPRLVIQPLAMMAACWLLYRSEFRRKLNHG